MPASRPWPPPPDLPSIQELVRTADPEGLLAEGAPQDEYDPEEQSLLAAIQHLPTAELVTRNILPHLEQIWQQAFPESDAATRLPRLLALAKEIERFFGPESKPRTRGEILANE